MSAAVQQAPESAPSRPGVVVRADLLPALGVLCAVAVLGLPLGWLWSRLAPPEFVMLSARAARPGDVLPFVGQSEHRFDDMATFVLLGLAAGVLTGATLWLLRQRRGPVVLVAAMLGSLVSAWLAMNLGLSLADARYPDMAATGVAFLRPPVLESSWVVVAQPFGATIAYCVTTAWHRSDDLGREWH
ncbi:MAG: DUF2567 domain-containing protein [Actinomycetota bacterium]|nr:DUF2567 domain-containing protein [Actinomycetota bacterium]